jgi:hypothetical protein
METELCKNPRARTAVFEIVAPTGRTLLPYKTLIDQNEERRSSTFVYLHVVRQSPIKIQPYAGCDDI